MPKPESDYQHLNERQLVEQLRRDRADLQDENARLQNRIDAVTEHNRQLASLARSRGLRLFSAARKKREDDDQFQQLAEAHVRYLETVVETCAVLRGDNLRRELVASASRILDGLRNVGMLVDAE